MCIYIYIFLSDEKNTIFLRREKNKEKKKKEGQSGGVVGEKKKSLVLSMDPTIFNLFTKRPFSNITWKIKTGMDEFS